MNFSSPVERFIVNDKSFIFHSGDKGRCVLSSVMLEPGDIVWSEAPSIFVPQSQEAECAAQKSIRENLLLSATLCDTVTTSRSSTGSSRELRQLYSNAFVHWVHTVPTTNFNSLSADQRQLDEYVAVYDKISSINHSCFPNCQLITREQDVDSTNYSSLIVSLVTVVRPIRQGEELTISYRVLATPRRTKDMFFEANYGFQCRCSLCQNDILDALLECCSLQKLAAIVKETSNLGETLKLLFDHVIVVPVSIHPIDVKKFFRGWTSIGDGDAAAPSSYSKSWFMSTVVDELSDKLFRHPLPEQTDEGSQPNTDKETRMHRQLHKIFDLHPTLHPLNGSKFCSRKEEGGGEDKVGFLEQLLFEQGGCAAVWTNPCYWKRLALWQHTLLPTLSPG